MMLRKLLSRLFRLPTHRPQTGGETTRPQTTAEPTRPAGRSWAGLIGGTFAGLLLGVAGALIAASVLTTSEMSLTIVEDDSSLSNSVAFTGIHNTGTISTGGGTWNNWTTSTAGKASLKINETATGRLALGVVVPNSYRGSITITVSDPGNRLGLTAGTGGWTAAGTNKLKKTIATGSSEIVGDGTTRITGKQVYKFVDITDISTAIDNDLVDGDTNSVIDFVFTAT